MSEKRAAELDRMCANWLTLARHVTKLSRDECVYILAKELRERDPPRPEFVSRMFFRTVRINREEMWKQLQKLFPGAGYRMKNGKKLHA